MRFSLLGGGQIRTTEHFANHVFPDHPTLNGIYRERIDLKVTAHLGDTVRVVQGEKDYITYEMGAQVVVLFQGNQEIADRTAATFRLMDNERLNFFALLDGAGRCAFCLKPLRDEISKLISVGPDCAKKYGVPHSRQAAEKRLELRKKLLGESKRIMWSYN
jgi:hypothetical protein